jgi:exodeoxyribonuclease VII large subunit
LAPPQIVRALQWLDGRSDIDTIIVARGGGSMEDLWAFNDEMVVRAIFAAQHPVISGVGHEVDFTIADFVADMRAPTPSAAAELAVPDIGEWSPILHGLKAQLAADMRDNLQQKRWQVQTLGRNLRHLSPRASLDNQRQRVDGLYGRLHTAIHREVDREQNRLAVAQAGLIAYSPLATLSRGYAIVRDGNGRIVRSMKAVKTGDPLSVQVSDGRFDVKVENE